MNMNEDIKPEPKKPDDYITLDHVPMPTYWNENELKMDIPEKQPEPKTEATEAQKAKADYFRWCEIVSEFELDLEKAKLTRNIKKRQWQALEKLESKIKPG